LRLNLVLSPYGFLSQAKRWFLTNGAGIYHRPRSAVKQGVSLSRNTN